MEQTNISILSTRPLDALLVNQAKQQGIDIEELSFIKTEPVFSIEVQQEIQQAFILTSVVVFTSMNAVEAVAFFLEDARPDWTIYCIGHTTAKKVEEYFGRRAIAGTADDAVSLADLIIADRFTNEIIFFCGDKRRDELPDLLRNDNFNVNEINVYQTISLPHKIKKNYTAILFFSPSAVVSFFENNQLPVNTMLFAIGNTTAAEIKKYTPNTIMIAEQPGKENMVKQAIEYFT